MVNDAYKIIKSLLRECSFFFFLSLIILLPAYCFNEAYLKEVELILTENLAPHSLSAIFVLATSFSSITLLFLGKYNPGKTGNRIVYKYIIFPVVKSGRAYSSTMTGMLGGLALTMLFIKDYRHAALSAIFMVFVIFYWSFFRAIIYFSRQGLPEDISERWGKIFLSAFIIILPCIYFYV